MVLYVSKNFVAFLWFFLPTGSNRNVIMRFLFTDGICDIIIISLSSNNTNSSSRIDSSITYTKLDKDCEYLTFYPPVFWLSAEW